MAPKVSIVVVVSERTEPFAEFYHEYSRPLRDEGIPYEFIVVAPASRRKLFAPLMALREAGEPIALFESAPNVGEAGLLRSVIAHTRGEVILMLSAYRRVAAESLPVLVRAVEAGADLVVARRSTVRDSAGNRIQRRFVHALVRALVGGNFHDLGSGVRASRREVLEELPVYGEFARFLPLFAVRDGFRVEEIEVAQHAADRRTRVYPPGTYLRRLMDLLAVFFLVRFRDKPMRFFGLAGGLVSLVGALVLLVLGAQRVAGQPLADRPMLLVGVLLFVLGVQGVALGLIGEIIVHAGAKRRKVYRLAPPKAP